MAAARIMSGMEDMIVAGGVESMSRVPMGSAGGALFFDSELMTKTGFVSQGVSADLIATIGGDSRDDADAFALGSQRKAAAARGPGTFPRRVVAGRDPSVQDAPDPTEFINQSTTLSAHSP